MDALWGSSFSLLDASYGYILRPLLIPLPNSQLSSAAIGVRIGPLCRGIEHEASIYVYGADLLHLPSEKLLFRSQSIEQGCAQPYIVRRKSLTGLHLVPKLSVMNSILSVSFTVGRRWCTVLQHCKFHNTGSRGSSGVLPIIRTVCLSAADPAAPLPAIPIRTRPM